MTAPQQVEKEGFVRGFHGIPDASRLMSMSFAELASELSSSEPGSPKYIVIEREIKRHLAKDQAGINQKNIIIGVCIGGLFTVLGTLLGWWLRV